MFYFLNIDNPSNSEAFDKGVLFEGLCKTIIDACGYKNITMRVKNSNLEYDIEATNKITEQKLIGEAKAHQQKISSEIMVFFAKMNIYWLKNADTWGIFISTSDLTSDVRGQIDILIENGYHFKYLTGENIIKLLSTQLNFISIEQVKNISEEISGYNSGETYFLVTDRGYYYVQLLIKNGYTLPEFFCCYDSSGKIIEDFEFLKLLKLRLEILKELEIYMHADEKINVNNIEKATFLGVISGKGWFDYQFPAPSDKFIGRKQIMKEFFNFIEEAKSGETNTKVCEILSRSGVGKSSITIRLEQALKEDNNVCVVADSRNIRSDIDVLQLFQQLINECNIIYNEKIQIPKSKSEIGEKTKQIDCILKAKNKLAVICLDQFESLFSRTNMYNSVLDLILEFNNDLNSFVFCIARKNDQPTTYDESSQIDLNRLKSISKKLTLHDFNVEEAIDLISHINDEIGTSLIKPLKEQVLEISNGFPWLLKKYCAHIIKLVKSGRSQREIVQSGMQLEYLFSEDIESLDEQIREFFNRLIYFLPATYSELAEAFTEVDLSDKLRALQNDYRLIRLTGRTYDTYNDVLKEYVKTGHVNLTKRYLVRSTPRSIIRLFENIIKNNYKSLDEIVKNSVNTEKTIVNFLKELRQLELVDGDNANIEVDKSALTAFKEDNLPKYISNVLMNNSLVRGILEEINKKKIINIQDVKEILMKEMPFIEASEKIWTTYAIVTCKWLNISNLAIYKNGQITNGEEATSNDILNSEEFLPSTQISQITKFVEVLAKNEMPMSNQELKVVMKRKSLNGFISDGEFLGFVKIISRSEVQITEIGKNFINADNDLRSEIISERILKLRYIELYKNISNELNDSDLAFRKVLEELKIEKWNDTSIKWKHKMLRNWLLYTGDVSRKNRKNDM